MSCEERRVGGVVFFGVNEDLRQLRRWNHQVAPDKGEGCRRYAVDNLMDSGGQRGLERAGLEVDVDGSSRAHALEQTFGERFGAGYAVR